jgi:hypothetical protein
MANLQFSQIRKFVNFIGKRATAIYNVHFEQTDLKSDVRNGH